MSKLERRLLWTAIAVLLALQVVPLFWGATPDGPEIHVGQGSTEDLADRVRRLEERIHDLSERNAARPTPPRAKVDDGSAEQRLAALEARLQKLQEAKQSDRSGGRAKIRALNAAIAKGDAVTVARALFDGVDPNGRDEDGQTPLCKAAAHGKKDLIRLLMRKDADLERTGDRGMTPLLAALDGDQEEVAMDLLDIGADGEAVDKNGENALMWACFNGCGSVAKRLIAAGVDIHVKDHGGDTALSSAARRGHYHITKHLLDSGADPNTKNRGGETPLSLALRRGHLKVAELLRSRGAK